MLEKADLSYSREFVHMVEKEDSIIKKTINDLLNESDQWGGIISSLEEGKKTALLKALDIAKDKQIKEEEDFLISSKLSPKKIEEFIKGFLDGYKGNCAIHTVFEKCGQYEDQVKQIYKGPQKSIGYNRLDEKGAFIDGWYVHYSSWGEQYGNGMARSENSDLFDELCEQLSSKQATKENIIDQIESTVQELVEKKINPNIIITSLDFDDFRMLSSDGRFIPHWHKDCPKKDIPDFHGILRLKSGDIPVIRLFREKKKGIIGIFDLNKFATLIQLNPIDIQNGNKYVQSQFYIRIFDLNEDDQNRNSIILTAPDWLNKYSDKERYLKSKVIVKTFMRQELYIKDKGAGVLLKADNVEQEDRG